MKILVYPKDPNPYQELIYSQLRSRIEIKYLENPTRSNTIGLFMLFLQLPYFRIKRYTVFHIHWFYTFYPPFKNRLFNNLLTKALYSLLFIIFILFIKLLRYHLIWTVHNVIPLEKQFINDVWIVKILSNLSDSKIVHSKTTIKNMQKLGINTENYYIIPIGNYTNIYLSTINKKDSREKLGIKKDNFVFCFFGKVENYKGVVDLLNNFLLMEYKDIILIIAGECHDSKLKKTIMQYKKYNNIILHINYIPDDMVQIYLNAADIMVYPFQMITTSSSVILALSFGKPIICPRTGNLEDLPENVGFFYKLEDKLGLFNCLKKAIDNKDKLENMGKLALGYTENLSWNKIAEKTYEVYKTVI